MFGKLRDIEGVIVPEYIPICKSNSSCPEKVSYKCYFTDTGYEYDFYHCGC